MKEENKTRELKKKERKVKEKEDFKLKILRKFFHKWWWWCEKRFFYFIAVCRVMCQFSIIRKKEVIVKKLMENKVCAVNYKKI